MRKKFATQTCYIYAHKPMHVCPTELPTDNVTPMTLKTTPPTFVCEIYKLSGNIRSIEFIHTLTYITFYE